MKQLINDLLKELRGADQTVKSASLPDGTTLCTFLIPELAYRDSLELSSKYEMVFLRGFELGPKEWSIWIIEKKYDLVEIWETLEGGIAAQEVKTLKLAVKDDGQPMMFLTQRTRPDLETGIGFTMLPNNGVRIEVNPWGDPRKLN